MENILGYYIYESNDGGWLSDDGRSFTRDLNSATCFATLDAANIDCDQWNKAGNSGTFYVMACMGSV